MLIHCKDFTPTPIALIPTAPGEGRMNYRHLVKKLSETGKIEIPFIMEGVSRSAIPQSVRFLRALT